ncbi:MAG: hypothetical protein WCW17_03690 [Patescibacteria group bacterium]
MSRILFVVIAIMMLFCVCLTGWAMQQPASLTAQTIIATGNSPPSQMMNMAWRSMTTSAYAASQCEATARSGIQRGVSFTTFDRESTSTPKINQTRVATSTHTAAMVSTNAQKSAAQHTAPFLS